MFSGLGHLTSKGAHTLKTVLREAGWQSGRSGSTHTASVGAGIGRNASQPLHIAMDRNSLLLVCSLQKVTIVSQILPAC